MSERKPLTPEAMRRMVIDDSDCMAFVVVHDIEGDYDVAAVLDEVFGDGICAAYSVGPVEYREKDYGKTWLAYAYEPPRLDRSAWEPCAECRSCDNCKNNSDYDPDEGIYGECGQCREYSNFEPCNFCRECGRPLTDAAWDMLEKRLEGAK